MGAAAAMCSTIYYRELQPYRDDFTNLLGTVAQYQILFTYVAALLLVALI